MGKHNTKRTGTPRTDAALRDLEALTEAFDAWAAKHWPVALDPDLDDGVDATFEALRALRGATKRAGLDK